ncbi:unnamed protein product [Somion occarium]|uniref:Uncharacterized protein n=1 Tax=Somion occarium TaxID=3059160 RepID=A0ABP1DTC0_9APHY
MTRSAHHQNPRKCLSPSQRRPVKAGHKAKRSSEGREHALTPEETQRVEDFIRRWENAPKQENPGMCEYRTIEMTPDLEDFMSLLSLSTGWGGSGFITIFRSILSKSKRNQPEASRLASRIWERIPWQYQELCCRESKARQVRAKARELQDDESYLTCSPHESSKGHLPSNPSSPPVNACQRKPEQGVEPVNHRSTVPNSDEVIDVLPNDTLQELSFNSESQLNLTPCHRALFNFTDSASPPVQSIPSCSIGQNQPTRLPCTSPNFAYHLPFSPELVSSSTPSSTSEELPTPSILPLSLDLVSTTNVPMGFNMPSDSRCERERHQDLFPPPPEEPFDLQYWSELFDTANAVCEPSAAVRTNSLDLYNMAPSCDRYDYSVHAPHPGYSSTYSYPAMVPSNHPVVDNQNDYRYDNYLYSSSGQATF